MKKFSFNLRSVHTIRSIHELRAREVFSAALMEQRAAVQALAHVEERLQALDAHMLGARQGTFRAPEQVAFLHEHLVLEREIAKATEVLAKADQKVSACRAAWIHARRDVRVMEKLEAKARERHRRDCDHEEQAAIDDRVNAMTGRAPLILS